MNSVFSRYIDYIYAEGKIVALHVHNVTANADSIYYVQTDPCGSRAQSQVRLCFAEMEQGVRSKMLGSWDRIVDGNPHEIRTLGL